MKASSIAGTWAPRAALVASLAAALVTVAGPAGAQPIPENAAWKQYVLGDGAPDATPVRIASTSGAVTNAEGLVRRSKRPTTLTFDTGQPAPTIVLDYGREVGGLPFFSVGRVAPADGAAPVSLRAASSEAR
jgi:alpha-L-rhamnosidase